MYKLRCPECKKTDRFQVEQQHDTARAECGWCEYVWYPRCLQPTKRAWKRGYKVVTRHGSGQLTSFFSGTKDTVLYHKGIVARPNEGYGKLSVFDSFEHANTFRLQHSYREKLEGQSHEIWLCDYMGEAIAGAKSIPIGTIRTSAVRLIERRYPAPPSVPPNVVIYRGWKVVARCGNGERVSFVMSDDQEVTYEKDVWSRRFPRGSHEDPRLSVFASYDAALTFAEGFGNYMFTKLVYNADTYVCWEIWLCDYEKTGSSPSARPKGTIRTPAVRLVQCKLSGPSWNG